MRKLLALILCFSMVVSWIGSSIAEPINDLPFSSEETTGNYESLDDPALLQYIEDSVYSYLDGNLSECDFIIDNVDTIYVSKEYLEEVAYNKRANVFFGYALSDINEAFGGKRYVFTCNDIGETVVQEFQEFPDNTNEIILKNIAVGTGVILVCVTVTVISGGIAGPAAAGAATSTAAKVSLIFAASAKTATSCALSGAAIGALSTAVVKGYETNDLYESLLAAEVAGSEAFKWGAISGAVVGGTKEALRIRSITNGTDPQIADLEKQVDQTSTTKDSASFGQAAEGPAAQSTALNRIPSPQEAEAQALHAYGGETQQSYINGVKVPYGTPGSTRPDIVRFHHNHLEAIEVKRYDLQSENCLNELKKVLIDEISRRNDHLPPGSLQRIVLNVEGRGYSMEFVSSKIKWIQEFMEPYYHNIPVDVMGELL